MIAYSYDNNGFYLGTTQLQESPLEPGVYFSQPNTTTVQIPNYSINQIPFWNGSGWEIKPNFSGVEYWNINTKESKYFEPGESKSDEYTDKKPPSESYYVFKNGDWVIDQTKYTEYQIGQCKNKAKALLANSDWSTLPDVQSNLLNVDEFVAYRATLRNYAINPVENPTWPVEPEARWK